jgi:hypothetical protein
VKVDGKEIAGSNISDLVSDAVRARKNFNPTGSREFFKDCQGLIYQGILRETQKGGRRSKDLAPLAMDHLLYRHLLCRYPNGRHPRTGHGVTVSIYGAV